MPVKVPTLERAQPIEPSSQGRLDVQAPNVSRLAGSVEGELAGLAAETGKLFDRIEKEEINTSKIQATTEYAKWWKTKMNGDSEKGTPGLRHLKGDPTQAYNKFDNEADEKRTEIFNKVELSEKGKQEVKDALTLKHSSLYQQRLVAYGNQSAVYKQEVVDSGVGLEKQDAVEAVSYVQAGEESTLAPFQQTLDNIQAMRVQHGIAFGTVKVTENEEGMETYKLGPSVKYEIATDKNEAVYDSINLLVKDKRVEEAKYMLKNYSNLLDPVNKGKIDAALEDAEVEVKAYEALSKLETKTFPEQRKIVKGMSTRTAQQTRIKQEALKLLDANERYRDNIQRRDSTEVYNKLANHIADKMQSNAPYDNVYQLQADSQYKNLIHRVTDAKQRKALVEMIESPKDSDEQAYERMLGLAVSGEFFGMNESEFMVNAVGLSDSDRRFFRGQFVKQKTETESQERSKSGFIAKELRRQADEAGLIKRDRFGKPTKSSRKMMNELQTQILMEADQIPKNLSVEEATRWSKRIILEKVKEQESQPGVLERLRSFISGEDVEDVEPIRIPPPRDLKKPLVTEPTSKKSKGDTLSPQEMTDALNRYKKAHDGARPKSLQILRDWLEKQEQGE